MRTLTFAITDGAVPSNEGRGYVLRRILRRAVRYGVQTLGAPQGFFAQLVPILMQTMGPAFPELRAKESEVVAVIEEEERAFSALLVRGVRYLNELVEVLQREQQQRQREEEAAAARIQSGGGNTSTPPPKQLVISGETAFFLYDSLGFPLDLTQLMAAERGIAVDAEGFHAAMAAQQQRSRDATRNKRISSRLGAQPLVLGAEQTAFLQQQLHLQPTDDAAKYEWDVEVKTEIQAIFTENGFVESLTLLGPGNDLPGVIGIVTKKTPFYAESGGQAPDTGTLTVVVTSSNGDSSLLTLDVLDVQVSEDKVSDICMLSVCFFLFCLL